LGKPVYENLTPPQPVPIIFILGKADPFVPFDGGEIKIGSRRLGIVVSARQAIDFWVQANHCADQTEPDRIIIDGETITKTRYWGQTDRSDIAEISIEEAGHSWPGGWQYLPKRLIGDTSQAVNATAEIWEFFKAHALKD
jgi:polyhydroxybutyrate depolymerase